MKKTMFITSVIMVVVMAVALTTSSLAWFSATGSSNVTTNTLKLTAKGTASTGISISNNGTTNWGKTIDLITVKELNGPNLSENLMPLVPYTKSGSEATTTELITALLGGTEQPYLTQDMFDDHPENYPTLNADNYYEYDEKQAANERLAKRIAQQAYGTQSDTTYGAYMIGAEVGLNDLFTNKVDRTGFMYDTFYIKNDAAGAGSLNIKLNATVNFTFGVARDADMQHETAWVEQVAYNETNRGAARYSSDATLCVVVLVAKNQFDTTDNINTKIESTAVEMAKEEQDRNPDNIYDNPYDKGWDPTNPANWEILVFAKSKLGDGDDITNETVASRVYNITLGKQATDFDGGSTASVSIKTLNLYDYMNDSVDSYDYLRPDREYEGKTIEADKKLVKVIAWYDGVGLNNNNSSVTDLQFDLEFKKVASDAWDADDADIYNPEPAQQSEPVEEPAP